MLYRKGFVGYMNSTRLPLGIPAEKTQLQDVEVAKMGSVTHNLEIEGTMVTTDGGCTQQRRIVDTRPKRLNEAERAAKLESIPNSHNA